MRAALDAIAEDLAINASDIVPASLTAEHGHYNADVVWARLLDALPEAMSARLLRRVAKTHARVDWRRIMQQAAGAGRLLIGAMRRPSWLPPSSASRLLQRGGRSRGVGLTFAFGTSCCPSVSFRGGLRVGRCGGLARAPPWSQDPQPVALA
ncbi:MAG: hypothetical protein R3D67_03425 [Hyphomicrobiaceae bacterium]